MAKSNRAMPRDGSFVPEQFRVAYEMCQTTKRWQPKLVVYHPDMKNPAEYRTQYLVAADGNNRADPEKQPDPTAPENQVLYLLINGNGEVWVDQATNEPVVLPCEPLVMVQADETHVKMADAKRLTGYSQQTIWRAAENGELSYKQLDEKNRRYAIYDLRQWQGGKLVNGAKARKKGD